MDIEYAMNLEQRTIELIGYAGYNRLCVVPFEVAERLKQEIEALRGQVRNQESMLTGKHEYTGQDFKFRIDKLTAERDAAIRERDEKEQERLAACRIVAACAALLPDARYMDTPDGGTVSVPEQLRRMIAEKDAYKVDAERYRWLRDWNNMNKLDALLIRIDFDTVDEAVDAARKGGEQP